MTSSKCALMSKKCDYDLNPDYVTSVDSCHTHDLCQVDGFMGPLGPPRNLASGSHGLFVRAHSRGFLAALPWPLRRIPAEVYATTPNAAHYHCIMHGEAAWQHRILPPSLHERRTVRLALLRVHFGHPLRPRSEERRRARLTAPRSGTDRLAGAAPLASRQGSCKIWDLQL